MLWSRVSPLAGNLTLHTDRHISHKEIRVQKSGALPLFYGKLSGATSINRKAPPITLANKGAATAAAKC